MPSLPEVENLNDGQYPQTVQLRPSSVTLAMVGFTYLTQFWRWQGASGDTLSPTELDDVQAMCDGFAEDIMLSMVGMVFSVTGDCPEFCLECDGSVYANADYPRLATYLDAVFHTDSSHFRVPNLEGQAEIGLGTSPEGTIYAMDEAAGAEAVTLTASEMPAHTHIDAGHTHVESGAAATAITIGAGVPAPSALPVPAVTAAGFASLSTEGGSVAHENRPPVRALRKVIVAF